MEDHVVGELERSGGLKFFTLNTKRGIVTFPEKVIDNSVIEFVR